MAVPRLLLDLWHRGGASPRNCGWCMARLQFSMVIWLISHPNAPQTSFWCLRSSRHPRPRLASSTPPAIIEFPTQERQSRDRQALTSRVHFGCDDGSMTALGLMSAGQLTSVYDKRTSEETEVILMSIEQAPHW